MENIKLLLPKEATQVEVSRRKDAKGARTTIAVIYKGRIWRPHKGTWYFKSERKSGDKWLHREIYEDFVGEIPSGMVIHHKNGVLDNLPENLEPITREEHLKEHETGKRIQRHWKEGRFKEEGLVCRICGKTFTGNIKTAKVCGKECFLAHRRERRYAAGAVPRAESGKRIWETRRLS